MKSVILSGAAGGIGHAAAKRLIEEGYTVFGLDIRKPEETEGLQYIYADLTDLASVEQARDEVRSRTESVDAIIHLAGIYDLNSLVEMEDRDFQRIFEINLFSVFRINKTFLPLLKQGGRILITSSELAPLDPLPFTGIYGITKSAVEKYAYSLRMELQLLGYRVIILRPGAVETGLLDVSTDRMRAFVENTDLYSCNAKRFANIVNRVEARKIPPEKMAQLVCRAVTAAHPHYVYTINRNPLLLIMNLFPDRMQHAVIRMICK